MSSRSKGSEGWPFLSTIGCVEVPADPSSLLIHHVPLASIHLRSTDCESLEYKYLTFAPCRRVGRELSVAVDDYCFGALVLGLSSLEFGAARQRASRFRRWSLASATR